MAARLEGRRELSMDRSSNALLHVGENQRNGVVDARLDVGGLVVGDFVVDVAPRSGRRVAWPFHGPRR